MMDGGSGWIGWTIGLIVMVGFLALLVWALTTATRQESGPARQEGAPRPQSAEEILAARYARGEIDEAEFGRRREALGAS